VRSKEAATRGGEARQDGAHGGRGGSLAGEAVRGGEPAAWQAWRPCMVG
jgi:hypothetical protein